MSETIRILYVDDYPLDRALVRDALGSSSQNFEVLEAATEKEFNELMAQGNFDLVLTDFNILGFTGLQVLDRIQTTYPGIPVIMVTGTGSEEIAAEAIKRGAADYVIKTPHYIQRLPHTIQNALANQVLQQQRRDALKQLRENEQRYRELVENLSEGIWGIDKEGMTTFVNPAMTEILGYSVEEMLGKQLFDFMDREGAQKAEEYLERRKEGIIETHEFEFIHKNGTRIDTLINTRPIIDQQGQYQGALAAVQDITERKKTQLILEENEEKYRSLVNNLGAALFLHNLQGRIVDVNQAAVDRYGYTRKELLEMQVQKIDSEIEERGDREQYWQKLDQGSPQHFEARHRTRAGKTFPVEVSLTPVSLVGEEHIIAIAQDITERKKAGQELEQARQTLDTVLESVDAHIYVSDFESYEILYMNQKMKEDFGDELIGSLCYQEFRGEQKPCNNCQLEQLVDKHGNPTAEQTWEGFNPKTERWYLNTDRAIYWTDQRLAHIQIAVDIHDRKLAEEELQKNQEFLSAIYNQSLNAIMVADDQGNYLDVNQAAADLFGYTIEELQNMNVSDLRTSSDPDAARRYQEYLKTGQQIGEFDFIQRSGEPRVALYHAVRIGENLNLSVLTDITRRKSIEMELQKSDSIVKRTTDAVITTLPDGTITFWNQGAELIYGYSQEEALGKSVSMLYPEKNLHVLEELISTTISGDDLNNIQVINLNKNREQITTLLSLTTLRDDQDQVLELVGVSKDISVQARMQKTIKENEARYRLLFDSALEGLVIHQDGIIQEANNTFLDIYRCEQQDVIGSALGDFAAPESNRAAEERIATPTDSFGEYMGKRCDGSTFPILLHAKDIEYHGKKARLVSILDITERKAAESTIREINQQLLLAQEIASIGNWSLNPEIGVPIWSDEVYQIYERDPALGPYPLADYQEIYQGVHWERFNKAIQGAIQKGEPYDIELKLELGSGKTKWIRAICRPVPGPGPAGHTLHGTIQDITQIKAAELALQESEQKYRQLFENMLNGFALHQTILNKEGQPVDYVFLEVNKAFENLTGLKAEDIIGRKATHVLPGIENDPANWIERYGEIALGAEAERYELFSESIQKWYSVLAYQPEPGQFATIFEDITERKAARDALLESEKRYRQLFESFNESIVIYDRQARFVMLNRSAAKKFDLQPAEMVGRFLKEYIPDNHKMTVKRIKEVLDSGEIRQFEDRLQLPDGDHWFITSMQPIQLPGDDQTHVLSISYDITERIESETAIRESETRYRNLVESSPDGIITISKTGKVMSINQRFLKMTGYLEEEILHRHFLQVPTLLPQDLDFHKNIVTQILQGKSMDPIEFRWKHASGEIRDGEARTSPLRVEGEIIGLLGIVRDITERKKAEQKIHESEQRYRQLYQTAGMGVGYWTTEGKVISFNEIALKDMQMTSEELVGKHLTEIYPEEQAEVYLERIQTAAKSDTNQEYEDRVETAFGTRWFLSVYSAVEDIDGQVQGVQISSLDITRRKQIETELVHSRETAESYLNIAAEIILTLDKEGVISMLNPSGHRLLGYPDGELIGENWFETCLPADELDAVLEVFQGLKAGEANSYQQLEGRIKTRTGRIRNILWHNSVLRDESGEFIGTLSSGEDITARIEVENQLREREAILNRSQEIARVGSYIWNLEDDSLIWSDNMYSIHGLDRETFSGNLSRVSQQVIHPEDQAQVQSEIQQMIQNKKVHSMQFRVLLPDGEERVMRSSGEFEFNPKGKPIRAIGVHQDITEEIKTQQQILESQELLVRLSRAAHSVQNILDPEVIFETIGREISALGFNTIIMELNENQTRLHFRYNSFSSQLINKMITLLDTKSEDFSFKVNPGGYFDRMLQGGKTLLKPLESQPFQEVFPGIPRPVIKQIQKLFNYEASILAPLTNQNQPLGLLMVLGSEITEEDLTPVDIFANQASTALRNARYAAALKERAEELGQLTTTLEETEEAERTRMAQELHDQVGQSLALLGFNLNMIKSQLKKADIKDLEKIYDAQTLLEEISDGIRSVMDDLRPSILDDYGLLAALHWLSDKYSERTGIEVEVAGTASEPRLDLRVENSLFRIIQEALTNVARHAEADQVKINLIQKPEEVELILEDNGKGFDTEMDSGNREHRGWGLINMNERANRIGGELRIESGLGKGTRIFIQAPRG